MGRPKIERGLSFDGGRVARVTFDLKATDVGAQIDKFFAEHGIGNEIPVFHNRCGRRTTTKPCGCSVCGPLTTPIPV